MKLYKCTRANGTDFRTGSLKYKPGAVLEVENPDPASAGACGRGLHLCRTPIRTCLFGDRSIDRGRWRWFEVEVEAVDIIAEDSQKVRVRKLTVVREVKKREIFGDLKARAKKCRAVAATFKRIPWLKPKRRVTDKEVAELVRQWREALQPWTRVPLPTGLRVVRTAAADAADADAATVAAATVADAADAADAAAATVADAATVAAATVASNAAAAAADAAAKWHYCYRYWYIRPYSVLRRLAWHELVKKRGQPNPWAPLFRLYKLGCLPIGYVKGKDGPEFCVYCPEPAKRGGK